MAARAQTIIRADLNAHVQMDTLVTIVIHVIDYQLTFFKSIGRIFEKITLKKIKHYHAI